MNIASCAKASESSESDMKRSRERVQHTHTHIISHAKIHSVHPHTTNAALRAHTMYIFSVNNGCVVCVEFLHGIFISYL